VLINTFSVITFPLINSISSLKSFCFPFFTPVNLNFDNLGNSSIYISRNILSPSIFVADNDTLENNFCSHSFLIALVTLSPGTSILSPTDSPDIALIVAGLK